MSELALSILMPVYNEHDRVLAALDEVLATDYGFDFELIVVDDGSFDGTQEILRDYPWPANARLLVHARNRGKGAAVRAALAEARGRFATIMDADLE
ncbi:MAG TPA: glycosyltransferase [Solirubrobacteraceae bacterium]|jgi:glycosyltransferase involved in cell wall biosynthesis